MADEGGRAVRVTVVFRGGQRLEFAATAAVAAKLVAGVKDDRRAGTGCRCFSLNAPAGGAYIDLTEVVAVQWEGV